jgi:hypothetical protein
MGDILCGHPGSDLLKTNTQAYCKNHICFALPGEPYDTGAYYLRTIYLPSSLNYYGYKDITTRIAFFADCTI